jgi:ATP-dependent Clp protease ATP-binding subunit ClpX
MLKSNAAQNKSHDFLSIKKQVSSFVVGQDRAVDVFSAALAMHLSSSVSRIKNNLIIAGPSGSGKTEIARSVEASGSVDVTIFDCSSITPSGYTGGITVGSIIKAVLEKCNWDIARSEKSLVILDEFDKVLLRNDLGGVLNQNEFLKLLDGGEFIVNKNVIDGDVSVKTHGMMFVALGTFVGVGKDATAKAKPTHFGLNQLQDCPSATSHQRVTNESLLAAGVIGELLGRFSDVIETHSLSAEQTLSALCTGKDSFMNSIKHIVEANGGCLDLDHGFLLIEAEKCLLSGLGVRGLRQVIEKAAREAIFRGREVRVDSMKVSKELKKVSKLKLVA